jgi:hypothetical protein
MWIRHSAAHLNPTRRNKDNKIYRFSDDPTATDYENGVLIFAPLVFLPLIFTHQGCEIIIKMPAIPTENAVRTTWSVVSKAINSVFHQCVAHPPSMGGTVVYHGLAIAIWQSPHFMNNLPSRSHELPPRRHSLG